MDQVPERLREEILAGFDEYRTVHMATVDGDAPRVRPVTLNLIDGVFYILTGAQDVKIAQLRENPRVELCLSLERDEYDGYVRLAGSAKMIEDAGVKRVVAERVDYFKVYWKGYDDPSYTLLEIVISGMEYMEPGGESVRAERFRW